MGNDLKKKPGFDNLEFIFQNQNQQNKIDINNPITNFCFDNNFQNKNNDPKAINRDFNLFKSIFYFNIQNQYNQYRSNKSI
jgi:hypothetical protein